MVYPLFKKFIEKTTSASRSRTTGQVDSRGYKLSSVPVRSETGGRRTKPSASVPNETTWGSKENIIFEREQGAHSSGDDASLELPKHQAGASSFAESEPQHLRSMGANHQIVVTKEYTVTETEPQRRDYGRSEF